MRADSPLAPTFDNSPPPGISVARVRAGRMTPRPLVLIVDDEPSICWSLAEALRDAGYDTAEATDAQQTLERLRRSRSIDVVLLDLRIPGARGLELLAAIRATLPACAVILMTAHAPADLKARALDAGASDVVLKPFELDQMVALTGRALGTHPTPTP